MKLFVGLPIVGQVPVLFLNSMMRLVQEQPCDLEVRICHGSGLMLARNTLCAQFLKSDADRLLFIDGDIVFTPEDVERISSHAVDVVGGFYAKKMDGPGIEWVNAAHAAATPRADGLELCDYVGTGFMCITRDVLETMRARLRHLAFGDGLFDWWTMGVWTEGERRIYLTEDYYFCKRWQAMGGELFADTKCVVQHIGEAVFPLRHQRRAA